MPGLRYWHFRCRVVAISCAEPPLCYQHAHPKNPCCTRGTHAHYPPPWCYPLRGPFAMRSRCGRARCLDAGLPARAANPRPTAITHVRPVVRSNCTAITHAKIARALPCGAMGTSRPTAITHVRPVVRSNCAAITHAQFAARARGTRNTRSDSRSLCSYTTRSRVLCVRNIRAITHAHYPSRPVVRSRCAPSQPREKDHKDHYGEGIETQKRCPSAGSGEPTQAITATALFSGFQRANEGP